MKIFKKNTEGKAAESKIVKTKDMSMNILKNFHAILETSYSVNFM